MAYLIDRVINERITKSIHYVLFVFTRSIEGGWRGGGRRQRTGAVFLLLRGGLSLLQGVPALSIPKKNAINSSPLLWAKTTPNRNAKDRGTYEDEFSDFLSTILKNGSQVLIETIQYFVSTQYMDLIQYNGIY